MRQSGRRTLIRTLAMAFALAVAGLAPAVASALSVTFNPAGNGTYEIHLDDNAGVVNQVALTTVTPSGGMPDLVIGDVTAGIMDPFPSSASGSTRRSFVAPRDDQDPERERVLRRRGHRQ